MVEYGKIRVGIKGPEMLMNRMNPEDLKQSGKTKKRVYVPEEEARKAAYITKVDGEEQLYIPSRWIYSMLVRAAGEYKLSGKRASIASLLAGTIRIEPEEILLGHCNYEIDERPVNIVGAKVLAWRPKIKDWSVEFDIVYNKMYIEQPEIIRNILEDGGVRLGIGDFRPQHKGWFGTFTVEKFEIAE